MYYYLESSLSTMKKGVRIPTLLSDISRGVKLLGDYAYLKQCGGTRGSLRFFNVLSRHLDMSRVYRATMKYSHRHHYTFTLYTTDGYRVVLKGVSGGYYVEGTRGCHDILKACGFSDRQCNKALHHESFEVRKNIHN